MLESVNRRSQHENSVWEFVETTVHQSVLNYQTETANRLRGSQEKMSATEVADMLVAAVQGENVTKVHMHIEVHYNLAICMESCVAIRFTTLALETSLVKKNKIISLLHLRDFYTCRFYSL